MSARTASPRERDARARSLAQEHFEGVLALEAGAGTGKTAVLVARVLAWVLGPGWERRAANAETGSAAEDRIAGDVLGGVVAITFTEAAAAEMGERVGNALRELVAGELPLGVEAERLPDEPLRSQRARALLGALDHLVVQSIHAFCRRVLASHPLEAGLHPRFQVDGDALGRRGVAREVVESALREAFSEDPDADWQSLFAAGQGPPEVEQALDALLEAGVAPEEIGGDPFDDAALAPLADTLVARLEALDAALGDVELRDNAAKLRAALHASVRPAGQESVIAFLSATSERFPENLRSRLREWQRGKFGSREREALGSATVPAARAAGPLHSVLGFVGRLDPELLGAGLRVLRPLLVEARGRMRARGIVPFEVLLLATRDLLRDHAGVLRDERRKIDQLLVDEFQDTDPLQCEILEALALSGQVEERPGLFLVGDPKQSIYGWRNADLAAYAAFVRDALGPDREPEPLLRNFRSTPEILAEVERLIAPVMLEETGLQPAFEPLLPVRESDPAARVPVEHRFVVELDADGAIVDSSRDVRRGLEARVLARELRERHEGPEALELGNVAILLSAHTDVDLVLEALRGEGVPFVVEGDRNYYRRREIQDVSALVRCILDPGDLVALLSWLRSPSVGVPDAAWLPLWRARLPELAGALYGARGSVVAELEQALQVASAELPELPEIACVRGFEGPLLAALRTIGELREVFDREPGDVFVEQLRRRCMPEVTESLRFLGTHRIANLERFFQELVEWLSEGVAVATLTRRLREAQTREPDPFEGPARAPAGDAVQVMTIHKAKGLDFQEVHVLQTDRGGRDDRRPFEVRRRADRVALRLFGASTPTMLEEEERSQRVRAAERVRTLYVAVTRAKDRLRIARPLPEAATGREVTMLCELLDRRAGTPPGLGEELPGGAGAEEVRLEVEGASFVFSPEPDERSARRSPDAPHDLESVARETAALADEAASAAERSALPLTRTVTDMAAAAAGELWAEGFDDGPRTEQGRAARGDAMRVGTAVHAALEELDPLATNAVLAARARQRLERELPSGPALEEASAIVDGFLRGPLRARMEALAPGIVGRELAVLLPPEPDDPTRAPVVGSADLVAREPDGQWVVVDYKTDRAPAADPSRYAAQGAAYTRALAEALGLERRPRFELWYLRSGEVVSPTPPE